MSDKKELQNAIEILQKGKADKCQKVKTAAEQHRQKQAEQPPPTR